MHGPAAQLLPLGDLLMYLGMTLLTLLGMASAAVPRWLRTHRGSRDA